MNKCLSVKKTREQETEFEGISSLADTWRRHPPENLWQAEDRTNRDLDLRNPGHSCKIRPYISKYCQAPFNEAVQLNYIFSINGDIEPTFPSLSAANFPSH